MASNNEKANRHKHHKFVWIFSLLVLISSVFGFLFNPIVDKTFYENGVLKSATYFRSSDSCSIYQELTYFDDGIRKEEVIYEECMRKAIVRRFYRNGQIQFYGRVLDGQYNGQLSWYFQNGVKEVSSNWVRGKEFGARTFFDSLGSLTEFNLIDFNGMPVCKIEYQRNRKASKLEGNLVSSSIAIVRSGSYIYSQNELVEIISKDSIAVIVGRPPNLASTCYIEILDTAGIVKKRRVIREINGVVYLTPSELNDLDSCMISIFHRLSFSGVAIKVTNVRKRINIKKVK